MLKKILKSAGTDAIKYFPVRLVPALTSFVTVPVFTRMITAADYGDFYLVSSTTSLASALITSWLTASIVRFYWAEEKKGRLEEYISTVIWASIAALIIGALIMTAGMYAFSGLISTSVMKLLPIAIIGLVFNQFIVVVQQLLRAANRATAFSVLSVAAAILVTIAGVFFVGVWHWGSYGILAGILVGNVVLVPFALKYVRADGTMAPRHFSLDTTRQFAVYGVPMIPAAVSSWILILSDRYIIGLTQTASQVGLYGTAYSLGDKIMNMLCLPLLTAIAPVMVQTFEKEGQKLAEQVQTQLTRYFLMATVPVLALLAVLSKPFMQVFTGPAYRAAFGVLPIVAAGVMFYSVSQIACNGLAMYKKTVIIMQNTGIAAAFQVCANLVLVPRFGYPAAAWDTLASYLLLLALAWVRSRPYMEWRLPWLDLAKVFGAGLVTSAVLYVVFGHLGASLWLLAVETIAGLAVYGLTLWGLKGMRSDEIEFLGEMWTAARRKLRLG